MNQDDPRHIIWNHIQKIGTCMLVTHDGDRIRARPMRGIIQPDRNAIWFITDANSEKDNDVARHPSVCLTFTDTHDQNFVSVSGEVERVDDRAQLTELWNEGAEAYYPHGKNDPSVVLLKFVPSMGEYWDAPSNPIVLAIKLLQANLTGERPDLGTNEATSLS